MKRIGNLFDQCFTIDNLYQAFLTARKGKRNKRAVFEFEKNLSSNLIQLHKEIHSETYQPKPYFTFSIYEAKPRVIHAPNFRDVVVQHAIYKFIYPIFDSTFIHTSYACRKGKGTHRCADFAQESMRKVSPDSYTLHLDVRKFFYSIDRNILANLLKKKIKDQRLLRIMNLYFNYDGYNGIPIGNLLSQIYASIYLNSVDHYIKRELKVKYYSRYVDDLVLIGLSKEKSNEYKQKIEFFLDQNLRLSLSKFTIAPLRKGINFVGYRTWKSKRFVRKHSLYQFRKRLKEGNTISLTSLMGHAKNTSTLMHYCKRINNERPDLIHDLPHFQ
jgi:retron-type reverse transcriptase